VPAAAKLPAEAQQVSGALRPDGRRVAIHPIDVRGRFIRARRVVFAALLAVYLAAPLVPIGGHPAIHLDVARRRFFLFGATFSVQDFWIVLFLITGLVFSLLFVTAWRGRAWCGWACPQTVFLEAMFRPLERLIDGPRSHRLKLAGAPWSAGRAARAAVKHACYLAAALIISHTALSLFLSASELVAMVREGPARHPVAFAWAVAMTGALYFTFAWFREQICVVLCPYGRLQSVLHDRDSIVIGYDARRGEPRGKQRRLPLAATAAGGDAAAAGDCIDCKKCVWACPTGIDIRNGLQMECLACAQCVDVCDEVMAKIGRPVGLIRYSSLNALDGRPTRVLRPRLYVYAAAALIAVGAAVIALATRSSFEATIVRQPGVPWVVEGTRVRNQLDVHVTNKTGAPARFRVTVDSPVPADVRLGEDALDIPALSDARIPLVITLERRDTSPGLTFGVVIENQTAAVTRRQSVRFVAPQR
jgi:cytochrome c oxidase accessory protein FixG